MKSLPELTESAHPLEFRQTWLFHRRNRILSSLLSNIIKLLFIDSIFSVIVYIFRIWKYCTVHIENNVYEYIYNSSLKNNFYKN